MIMIAAKATLLIAIAFAICALARHSRASFRHAVLASLFVLLLLLPFVPRVVPRVSMTVPMPSVEDSPPRLSQMIAETGPPRAAVLHERGWRPSMGDVYGAGVFLMLAWLAAGIVRLRTWANEGEVWLDGTRLATAIACDNGIRRAVLVVMSNRVAVPLTFGFRQQTIVLPEVARSWSEGLLGRAMRHELEHVRRNDWLLQILARVTCAVYWPHVLVWLAFRRFYVEAERTCDDAVVASFEPTTYADDLVSLARTLTRGTSVPALAMASPTRLAERVRAILDPGQRRGPHGRGTSIATFFTMAMFLITAGSLQLVASSSRPSSDDSEVVVKAAESGNIERLSQLLDRGDFKINDSFDGDGTALLIAAKHGRIEAVRWLMDHGADPNVASPGDGNPLIAAAGHGHVEVASLLLDRGARIDDIVPGDETALITAASTAQTKMVRFLIHHKANVNLGVDVETVEGDKVVREYRTALRAARRDGSKEIIELLVAAGARD